MDYPFPCPRNSAHLYITLEGGTGGKPLNARICGVDKAISGDLPCSVSMTVSSKLLHLRFPKGAKVSYQSKH